MCSEALVLEIFGVTRGYLRLTGIRVAIFFRCWDGDQTPELPVVRVVQLCKDHLTVLAVYLYVEGSACLPRSSVLATWHDHKARLNLPKQNRQVCHPELATAQPPKWAGPFRMCRPAPSNGGKTVLMLARRLCILYPRAMRWEQILKYK